MPYVIIIYNAFCTCYQLTPYFATLLYTSIYAFLYILFDPLLTYSSVINLLFTPPSSQYVLFQILSDVASPFILILHRLPSQQLSVFHWSHLHHPLFVSAYSFAFIPFSYLIGPHVPFTPFCLPVPDVVVACLLWSIKCLFYF